MTPDSQPLLRRKASAENLALLPYIDNPANERRWGDAKGIADRAGARRRGLAGRLEQLERAGYVESMGMGPAPSSRSDKPPRHWRLTRQCETRLARAWTSSSGYVPPPCFYCGKPVTDGHNRSSWEFNGRRVYAHAEVPRG